MAIHPADVEMFMKVEKAMHKVAKDFNLRLNTVTPLPMPEEGMADRMGDCSPSGHIRIVLRCTVNGKWCDAPLSPAEVWDTAAHELAHLRHRTHTDQFGLFMDELKFALMSAVDTKREKVIERILKLKAQKESETELGNSEAAEAFAAMINKMLIHNELQPSDLDYALLSSDEPIVEHKVDLKFYNITQSKTRSSWMERLAHHVGQANLCKILVRPGSNDIWFVGTRTHAVTAEYIFGTLVPLVDWLSKKGEIDYWRETGYGRGKDNKAKGFKAAWIEGFLDRIWQRFEEARKQAIAEAPVSAETGLMRLNSSMIKVQEYINDKFKATKKVASALSSRSANHSVGFERGVAAANKVNIGQRGIDGASSTRGLIG